MPGATTPDSIPYPVTGDIIAPLGTWLTNIANGAQAAVTALRNTVNTRVWGRASRVTSSQVLPAASTVLVFNGLAAGSTGVSIVNGGLQVSTDGVYAITCSIDILRTSANANTTRDFTLLVNGSTIDAYRGNAGSNGGLSAVLEATTLLPLSANDVVTFASSGAQPGDMTTLSTMQIARVSA